LVGKRLRQRLISLGVLIGCLIAFMFLYPVLYETVGTALIVLPFVIYALCEFLFEYVLDGSRKTGARNAGENKKK
jgi:uncharacterized membrane protein (DUF106 family)